MNGAGTITFTSGNKVGTTDFVTYTCSGTNAEFAGYGVQGVCLCLPKSTSTVTTSLISNFKHLQFNYFPSANYLSTMIISISEDGSSWTDITSSATGIKGVVNLDMPTPGSYYLKIQNTYSTNSFYISQIQYTTESCNCFKVR